MQSSDNAQRQFNLPLYNLLIKTKEVKMKESVGRHELKHYINYSDYMQLRSRLRHIASLDDYSQSGGSYRVRSLYFDNYYDKALHEKLNGLNNREKFRLRLYNSDTSFIRLEKKSKVNNLCRKDSEALTLEQAEEIIHGDYSPLKDAGSQLLLEFYAKLHYQQLRPKCVIDYNREAYIFPAGNVRVTIDSDIRKSVNVDSFLDDSIPTIPIQGTIILEVKYDNFLPEIIRGITSLSSRQSAAFSKYAAARLI